jgi:hypothetical protein
MGQQQPAYHITCTQSQAITNTYTLVHKYLMQRELELAKLRNSQGSDRHLDGVVVVRSVGTVLHLVLSHFLIVSTDVG